MDSSVKLDARLDDDELETILIIAKNEQSGRITPFEVRELVSAYRARADLYEALTLFIKQWNACGPNSDFGRYFSNVRDAANAALAKASGEAANV